MKSNDLKLNSIIESIIREADLPVLDGQDAKVAAGIVSAIAAAPYPKHSTNDKTIIAIWDKIDSARIELMRYVEDNSNYKFVDNGGRGWKLVKK